MRIQLLIYSLLFAVTLKTHAESLPETTVTATQQQKLSETFFYAARTGDSELMQAFIDAQANLDYQDHNGYSALMVAAFRGQKQIVDLLLDNQANTCLVDNRGNTALMAAIVTGELAISYRLISAGSDCDDQNLATRSMEFATRFGQDEVAKLLGEQAIAN